MKELDFSDQIRTQFPELWDSEAELTKEQKTLPPKLQEMILKKKGKKSKEEEDKKSKDSKDSKDEDKKSDKDQKEAKACGNHGPVKLTVIQDKKAPIMKTKQQVQKQQPTKEK